MKETNLIFSIVNYLKTQDKSVPIKLQKDLKWTNDTLNNFMNKRYTPQPQEILRITRSLNQSLDFFEAHR